MGMGIWKAMPSLGKVEADKWYHIEIITDYETQSVMYGVDEVYSGWLPSHVSTIWARWHEITYLFDDFISINFNYLESFDESKTSKT